MQRPWCRPPNPWRHKDSPERRHRRSATLVRSRERSGRCVAARLPQSPSFQPLLCSTQCVLIPHGPAVDLSFVLDSVRAQNHTPWIPRKTRRCLRRLMRCDRRRSHPSMRRCTPSPTTPVRFQFASATSALVHDGRPLWPYARPCAETVHRCGRVLCGCMQCALI